MNPKTRNLKSWTLKTRLAVMLVSILCLLTGAYAQITPLGDAYTYSADPNTNFGAATTLIVDGAKEAAYIQFNLSSIPAGASITQATLKIYVNSVVTAGSFEVYAVNGTWTESTLTYESAPALGSVIDSSVPITTADKNQYILIPMTSTVQGWVTTPSSNNGIALVAVGSFDATFDSKESVTTSHAPELDIVFASGIAGITTASGSGLTGGGTSGTLNLSLINSCEITQVLAWNGSAWACASTGTGTITGVTAGADLTGGGSGGNVTLSLNTANVPLLATANTFTANQTVNGAVSATGLVNTNSGFAIAGNPFVYGANGNVSVGIYAGNLSSTGGNNTALGNEAIDAITSGSYNTAAGTQALFYNTSGSANTATGSLALFQNTTGAYNTAVGEDALFVNLTGQYNTGLGYDAGTIINYNVIANGNSDTAVGAYSAFLNLSLSNATAIGANAEVDENNALVLGSIAGVNNGTASVSVGIGTTSPGATLDVRDNGTGTNIISAITSRTVSAVYGASSAASGSGANGGFFTTASPQGSGIVAQNTGTGGANLAAYLNGNALVTGNLEVMGDLVKGSGSFKIDHPLDPANKYLYHSFVESPDMMNVYNGNIVTNARGVATVVLPDYFEALNQDFRYQLTVIGQFAQAIVAKKIGNNRFVIRTSKPNVEVSWQVTGIRHDAYADAHRIEVEVKKSSEEQGRYLHPELFGAPAEQAIGHIAPPVPTKPAAQVESAQTSTLKKPTAALK